MDANHRRTDQGTAGIVSVASRLGCAVPVIRVASVATTLLSYLLP